MAVATTRVDASGTLRHSGLESRQAIRTSRLQPSAASSAELGDPCTTIPKRGVESSAKCGILQLRWDAIFTGSSPPRVRAHAACGWRFRCLRAQWPVRAKATRTNITTRAAVAPAQVLRLRVLHRVWM